MGGNGNNWGGHAHCLRERDEFNAGEGRNPAAGIGGAHGTRGRPDANRSRSSSRKRNAWHNWRIRGRWLSVRLRSLVAIGPSNLPRLNEIAIDARGLGFTFVLSVLSGLLFGLIPALKYTGPPSSLALQSAGRTISVSRDRHRARNLLVVGQVAMALVLLMSAGLMIRTFGALRKADPGFADLQHLQA